MALIVYPCGPGRGDLLRYALRSLEQAAGDVLPEVVLIGEIPPYVDCAALRVIPMQQRTDRFANVWRAWEVAGRLGERDWWWFNDDFIVTGPLAEALADTHRGSLESFCDDLARRGGVALYRRRAQAALDVLRAEGYADPYNWEAHTPLRACGHLVRCAAELCKRHGLEPHEVAVRTLIATLDHREGLPVSDPKIDHPRQSALPVPIASPGPRGWRTAAGRAVRERFPTPSHWERV